MAKIFFISITAGLLLFQANMTNAKCAFTRFWLWPDLGDIPINAVFILQGYGSLQDVVESMDEKSAYLQSGKHRTPLLPRRIYRGEMRISLVVLAPKEPLKAGVTYKLHAPSIEPGALDHYVAGGRKDYEWRVTPAADTTAPAFLAEPRVEKQRYIRYGCGPEVEVDVRVETSDENSVFAEVELKKIDRPDMASASYLLPARKGIVTIGHGMCSGAFRLTPDAKYEARITLVDIAGNRSSASSGGFNFIGPAP
ncbi:MAG: hypothetical protein GY859_29340 [Desulfobacterales bacterium]|nr:hypothetical protein [Desulfobacterales bacterium]